MRGTTRLANSSLGKVLIAVFVLALGVWAPAWGAKLKISGDYVEFRTADVYTGPCYANAEVGLTGHEAVLAWRIQEGSWEGVSLDGLSVVAVVRASATIGDPHTASLSAQAFFIVDERASQAQREALIRFAQVQTGGLLREVVAVESSPIRFAVEEGKQHGYVTLEAGELARISTRPINDNDHLCHNEEVYYEPLAENLEHAVPAVATNSSYHGPHLGVNWIESGRRGSFVATFSLPVPEKKESCSKDSQ